MDVTEWAAENEGDLPNAGEECAPAESAPPPPESGIKTIFQRLRRKTADWLKSCWFHVKPGAGGREEWVLTSEQRRGIISRAAILVLALVVMNVLLCRHLYSIQVNRHEHFVQESLGLSMKSQVIRAARGRILDINGNVFACDVASLDVYAEPRRFKAQLDVTAEIMARHLDLDRAELLRKLQEAASYNRFAMQIGSESVDSAFISRHRLSQLPGVFVEPVRENGELRLLVKYRPGTVDSTSRASTCRRLAEAFDLDEDELMDNCTKVAERCREVVVKMRASKEDVERMRAELKLQQVAKAGVRVVDSWVRTYPKDSVLANMLGYLDEKRNGVSGIEALMNRYLLPADGRVRERVDRRRTPVDSEVKVVAEAHPGADVYLTIDEPLQQIVEEELMEMCSKSLPVHAYAIMLEPSTGAVMALAQYPQFNPNDRQTMRSADDLQNHCLLQNYDPGSIMKAISLTGVLEAKLATLETKVDCERGRWRYGGRYLSDSHGYDILTLSEVIKKSSNIGTAKLTIPMGDEGFYNYLSRYQLDRRTNLGFHPAGGKAVCFPMEYTGGLPALRHWSGVSITRIPIGQGVSLTPMQIAQAWLALANNGVIMQPYIVDRVRYEDGRTEYSQPKVKATPVSAEAVRQMKQALVTVTAKDGTGRRAAVEGYQIAGKTGTAQLMLKVPNGVDKNGRPRYKYIYSNSEYLASFVGFAPAENPRFLLLVSIENPRHGAHSGGGAAAPVFKKIAQRTLQHLQVPPSFPVEHKTASAKR